jgi:hypothetical protein
MYAPLIDISAGARSWPIGGTERPLPCWSLPIAKVKPDMLTVNVGQMK